MAFSNPAPPAELKEDVADDEGGRTNLRNADFRSMLMTPRDPSAGGGETPARRPGAPKEFEDADDASAKRRKKKLYYAKLKKQEEEREKELKAKYRDRCQERREGKAPADNEDLAKTAQYKAVAPTADQVNVAAERRRMAIQESKFLGGDMEHTHLVKGLDYALLQKVRSEIANIESEENSAEATTATTAATAAEKEEKPKTAEKTEQEKIEFQTVLGRKIHQAAMTSAAAEHNELFQPGRMAYVFDVEEDVAAGGGGGVETDIPTTSIRSKADCPLVSSQATLTTNDIVINKLTQILSYLRQGMRTTKKMKKKEKELLKAGKDMQVADEAIFAETNAAATGDKRAAHRPATSDYFSTNSGNDGDVDFNKQAVNIKDFVKSVNEKFAATEAQPSGWAEVRANAEKKDQVDDKKAVSAAAAAAAEKVTSYAECYPGAEEMQDAADDTDDEADYTQMDMGNKKGPVKRWDFDNEDEYNAYMSKREALPKAAFQFGVKMSDGRKTRRIGSGSAISEKQKLDKEWQQISKLISKRKGDDGVSGSHKRSKDD